MDLFRCNHYPRMDYLPIGGYNTLIEVDMKISFHALIRILSRFGDLKVETLDDKENLFINKISCINPTRLCEIFYSSVQSGILRGSNYAIGYIHRIICEETIENVNKSPAIIMP